MITLLPWPQKTGSWPGIFRITSSQPTISLPLSFGTTVSYFWRPPLQTTKVCRMVIFQPIGLPFLSGPTCRYSLYIFVRQGFPYLALWRRTWELLGHDSRLISFYQASGAHTFFRISSLTCLQIERVFSLSLYFNFAPQEFILRLWVFFVPSFISMIFFINLLLDWEVFHLDSWAFKRFRLGWISV